MIFIGVAHSHAQDLPNACRLGDVIRSQSTLPRSPLRHKGKAASAKGVSGCVKDGQGKDSPVKTGNRKRKPWKKYNPVLHGLVNWLEHSCDAMSSFDYVNAFLWESWAVPCIRWWLLSCPRSPRPRMHPRIRRPSVQPTCPVWESLCPVIGRNVGMCMCRFDKPLPVMVSIIHSQFFNEASQRGLDWVIINC